MQVKLTRTKENHLSTLGSLSIDGAKVAVTLEDGARVPKVHGETRIPPGSYRLKLRTEGGVHAKYLERFGPEFHKGMIWLQAIPDFEFVYLHCGNKVSETYGCPLVGTFEVVQSDTSKPFTITESEKAYRKVYPPIAAAILTGADVRITVADPPKRDPRVA